MYAPDYSILKQKKDRTKMMFWRSRTTKGGTAPLITPDGDTVETIDGRMAAANASRAFREEGIFRTQRTQLDRRKDYDGLMVELIERYWDNSQRFTNNDE